MLCLARLPSSYSADAESHWQRPWTLVNSIFPVKHRGVFGRISVVEIPNTETKENDDYQWFARAVSDQQFLSFAVPKIMDQEQDMRIISILPSGEILARFNAGKPAFYKFSPPSNTWEALPPMISPPGISPTSPGVVIGDFFYVVVGCNRKLGSQAERLDLRSNKWEKIPAMHHPHIDGKCFAMDGRLFVLHATCFKHSCLSADIFDPATKQWTLVEDFLPPNNKKFSVAVLKNELYMLSWSDQRSLQKYDKSENKWVFVDFVPDTNNKFWRKKRLCPVGNELWVVDCEHRGRCACDEVLCETSVWPVIKGPSYCPPELQKTTPQAEKVIHAFTIGGIGAENAWRTIPFFRL